MTRPASAPAPATRRCSCLVLSLALSFAACAREPDEAGTPSRVDPLGADSSACPLGIRGTRVAVADTAGGVLIELSSPPEHLEELRRRVHDAAELRGAGSHQGQGHEGKHFGSHRHGLRLTSLPPVTTSVEETAAGASLQLTAVVPEHVDAVREQVRDNVARALRAPCESP